MFCVINIGKDILQLEESKVKSDGRGGFKNWLKSRGEGGRGGVDSGLGDFRENF